MKPVLQTTIGWESSNRKRSHPFSESASLVDTEGVGLGLDVFVDAVLHPVVERGCVAVPRLASIDPVARSVCVDVGGMEITGWSDGAGRIRLADAYGRPSGMLVPGPGWEQVEMSSRRREFDDARFAASVCCVVECPGVLRMLFGDKATTRQRVEIKGDDALRPVLRRADYGGILRFDATAGAPKSSEGGVRRIMFVSFSDSLIQVSEQDSSTVMLTSPFSSREDVCWNAHREDSASTISDTCNDETVEKCDRPVPAPGGVTEIMALPTDAGGIAMVADDTPDFRNGVMVSTVDGTVTGTSGSSRPTADGKPVRDLISEFSSMRFGADAMVSGNGVKVWFPGSSYMRGGS